jgi:hypothetical protein
MCSHYLQIPSPHTGTQSSHTECTQKYRRAHSHTGGGNVHTKARGNRTLVCHHYVNSAALLYRLFQSVKHMLDVYNPPPPPSPPQPHIKVTDTSLLLIKALRNSQINPQTVVSLRKRMEGQFSNMI